MRLKRVLPGLILCLVAACAPPESGRAEEGAPPAVAAPVRPGVEVLLSDSLHLVTGKRVGLITNRSGVGSDGTSSIDLINEHPDVELVALFAPEHGIRGDEAEGRRLGDEIDARTGLTVYSLYGETLAPTSEMLEGLDVLLFDLQDIGARYYTFVSTMAYAMRSAGEAGVPFVVLDRPNPIGGLAQGPVLDPGFSTFVGLYPVPVRHGMTAGELARLYVGEFGISVALTVAPASGWRRDAWFDDTDLPWIAPSPNMPTLESASHYPGTCLFEGTNVSVARGTPRAFQQIGAPWLDADSLAARVREHRLAGVAVEPVTFEPTEPTDGKFGGQSVGGVRLTVTDRDVYDPVWAGVALLVEARRLAGDRWEWFEAHFDRLAGSDGLRSAIDAAADAEGSVELGPEVVARIVSEWEAPLTAFETLGQPYLIY